MDKKKKGILGTLLEKLAAIMNIKHGQTKPGQVDDNAMKRLKEREDAIRKQIMEIKKG
jgi:hypothetical protein